MTIMEGKRPQSLHFDQSILLSRKMIIANKTYLISGKRWEDGSRGTSVSYYYLSMLGKRWDIGSLGLSVSYHRLSMSGKRWDIGSRGISLSYHCLSISTRRSNAVSINGIVAGSRSKLRGGPVSVQTIGIAVLSMSSRSRS